MDNRTVSFQKAILFMIISAIAFSFMNTMVKYLKHFPAYELVFFRSIGTFVICIFILIKLKVPLLGNQRKLLTWRAIFGALSMVGFFMAIKLIPFGSAVTFRYLSPIFAAIFAVLFLKESIKRWQWFFFILSFVGVLLLKGTDIRINTLGLASALGAAIATGAVFILIRKIGNRDHPLVIILYFMTASILLGGIPSIFDWHNPQGIEWLLLLSLGVFGFIGQYFMTIALQSAATNKMAPLKYVEALLAFLIGWIWFAESYEPIAIFGAVLIIAGMVMNVLYKD